MRTLLFTFMLLLAVGTQAQEKQFKDFEVQTRIVDYWHVHQVDSLAEEPVYKTWIYPLGFEVAFDSLRQEYVAKDIHAFYDYSYPEQDDLMSWLMEGDIGIAGAKNAGVGETEAVLPDCYRRIPESLESRLQQWAKEADKELEDCFDVYALGNNRGEVMSVYFELVPEVLPLLQEQELQEICDTLMQNRFDASTFYFRKHTNSHEKALADSLSKSVVDPVAHKRVAAWVESWWKTDWGTKECSYGVIHCYSLNEEKRWSHFIKGLEQNAKR